MDPFRENGFFVHFGNIRIISDALLCITLILFSFSFFYLIAFRLLKIKRSFRGRGMSLMLKFPKEKKN